MDRRHQIALVTVTAMVTIANRRLTARRDARIASYYQDRIETSARVAFNHGYGEGHRDGVTAARLNVTINPN